MPLPPPDPAAIAKAERLVAVALARKKLPGLTLREMVQADADHAAAVVALERLRGGQQQRR